MPLSVSVSIDVPNLAEGAKFYSAAFGFTKAAEPVPGVLVMRAGESEICLLEKAAGSQPAPNSRDMAFCSDPFGHGFCLIERRPRA